MGIHGGDTDSALPALATCCPDAAALLEEPEPAEPGRLRWTPLHLADLPGLNEIADILEPPLQMIVSVLEFVKGVLNVLSKLLIDITDPFRALILAAHRMLAEIIDALLDTSVHAYFDAPGLTSMAASARELGRAVTPPSRWKAGETSEREVQPGNFEAWAERFRQSFDDPGDDRRPILSDGATIEALFVVAAAPDLPNLRPFAELLGRLVDARAFRNAVEKYPGIHAEDFLADRDRFRVRGQSVAPDWIGMRLVDLIPVLEQLQHLPEMLKGLLLTVDNLIALLQKLIDAVVDKIDVLLQLAEAIQAVIDFIRALSATGLYGLAVSTDEGVAGLVTAFREAEDRPPGEHMIGACLLAAGGAALPVWALLGQSGKFDAAVAGLESDWKDLKEKGEQALADAEAVALAAGEDVDALYTTLRDELEEEKDALDAAGHDLEELGRDLASDRNRVVGEVEAALASGRPISAAGLAVVELTRRARRRGARSLAMLAASSDGTP